MNGESDYFLPNITATCLETAATQPLQDIVYGKNTVIDFWTTKCTRCPSALDKLNDLAQQKKNSNIHFMSICCDSCDGAREILEEKEDLKWSSIRHFSTTLEDKEIAKTSLGFHSVPFYVILDCHGRIIQR